MPSPSAIGRSCITCKKESTTVDKRYVNSKSKGERWYAVKNVHGAIVGYECHNCYMRVWSKLHRRKKKEENVKQ
jgi:hypothetical protein